MRTELPMSDLRHFVLTAPLVDTHEHMILQHAYLEQRPDILQMIFDGYMQADLFVAGAPLAAAEGLVDPANPDVHGRFAAVYDAWRHCRFTSYGEVVRLNAQLNFGIDELTPESLQAAQEKLPARTPADRLRLLRDVARLDHLQIDPIDGYPAPDPGGPDFFLYDINLRQYVIGNITPAFVACETGVEIRGVGDLRRALGTYFERFAARATAVKTQHAYNRTLRWQPRTDAAADAVVQKWLRSKHPVEMPTDGRLTDVLTDDERLCFGDWCWARIAELCGEYDLPLRMHTGYHAGHSGMPLEWVHPEHLCTLLPAYPRTRFVLMHTGYPFGDELLAIAKHYQNAYVDLCWAWTIDTRATSDFVRRFLRTTPTNKLFAFGGDTLQPTLTVGYAHQARAALLGVLEAEVAEGYLKTGDALAVAQAWMRDNQYACFNVEQKRAAAVRA
jgi:predicted TIM-barrel fold metal-dependent hydrolase